MIAIWFGSLVGGCAVRDRAQVADVEPRGRTQYASYCAACHHIEGSGVAGEAPPLTGSFWVTGPQERLIRIVLHGLRGPIEVGGKIYNREMPGFGQVLTDRKSVV